MYVSVCVCVCSIFIHNKSQITKYHVCQCLDIHHPGDAAQHHVLVSRYIRAMPPGHVERSAEPAYSVISSSRTRLVLQCSGRQITLAQHAGDRAEGLLRRTPGGVCESQPSTDGMSDWQPAAFVRLKDLEWTGATCQSSQPTCAQAGSHSKDHMPGLQKS